MIAYSKFAENEITPLPAKLDLYSNFVSESIKTTQSLSVTTATTTLVSSTILTTSPVACVPFPCTTLPPTPSNVPSAELCSSHMDVVIDEVAKGNFERGSDYDFYLRRKSRVSSTSSSLLSIESPTVSTAPSTPVYTNIPSSVPIPTTTSPCITLKPSISISSHSNFSETKGKLMQFILFISFHFNAIYNLYK